MNRNRTPAYILTAASAAIVVAAGTLAQQGVPSSQPGPRNGPSQPGPSNSPTQPGPKNPNPNPGNNNPDTNQPNQPNQPVDPNNPNQPNQQDPNRGVPPNAIPNSARGRYRGPFSLQDPQTEARFYDSAYKLHQLESRMNLSNDSLMKRLGDIRGLPSERQGTAMMDLMQQLIRDNQTLHEYLVQSRTAWSGDFEFPAETHPDREQRNNPVSNPGTQTPLQRNSDTPRDRSSNPPR